MSNPIPPVTSGSRHTVPALREQATRVRKAAEDVLQRAAREAEELRAAADELDAIADRKVGAVAPDATSVCVNCGNPIVLDPLGWRHPHENAGLCVDPAPPPPTAPFDAAPSGEAAV